MIQSFKLQIPTPCNQDWNNFTKTPNGGFCNQCNKEVIDFTRLTDTEIKEYFKNITKKSLCGSFREEQLNKEYKIVPGSGYSLYFRLGAFFFSLTAFLNIRNVYTQSLSTKIEYHLSPKPLMLNSNEILDKSIINESDTLLLKNGNAYSIAPVREIEIALQGRMAGGIIVVRRNIFTRAWYRIKGLFCLLLTFSLLTINL